MLNGKLGSAGIRGQTAPLRLWWTDEVGLDGRRGSRAHFGNTGCKPVLAFLRSVLFSGHDSTPNWHPVQVFVILQIKANPNHDNAFRDSDLSGTALA